MRAGELDRPIVIEQLIEDQDAHGGLVRRWAPFARTWAKRETKGGSESFTADQRSARQSVMFTVRHLPGVEPRMKVICDGQEYEIEDVSEPDRRTTLVLTCYVFEATAQE